MQLDDGYFFCLRAFLALSNSKLYLLAFIKRFKAGAVDVTKVNKNVRATFLLNKAKTFFCVKPFNYTSSHCESYIKYVIEALRGSGGAGKFKNYL